MKFPAIAESVLDKRTMDAAKNVIEKVGLNPSALASNLNKVVSGDAKDIIRSAVVKAAGGPTMKPAVPKPLPPGLRKGVGMTNMGMTGKDAPQLTAGSKSKGQNEALAYDSKGQGKGFNLEYYARPEVKAERAAKKAKVVAEARKSNVYQQALARLTKPKDKK